MISNGEPISDFVVIQAQRLTRGGDIVAAQDLLVRNIDNYQPTDRLLELARLITVGGSPEQAAWLLQQAMRVRPHDDQIKIALGFAHRAAGQTDKMAAVFEDLAQRQLPAARDLKVALTPDQNLIFVGTVFALAQDEATLRAAHGCVESYRSVANDSTYHLAVAATQNACGNETGAISVMTKLRRRRAVAMNFAARHMANPPHIDWVLYAANGEDARLHAVAADRMTDPKRIIGEWKAVRICADQNLRLVPQSRDMNNLLNCAKERLAFFGVPSY